MIIIKAIALYLLFGYGICYLVYKYISKKGKTVSVEVFERLHSMQNKVDTDLIEYKLYQDCKNNIPYICNTINHELTIKGNKDYLELFPNKDNITEESFIRLAKKIVRKYSDN